MKNTQTFQKKCSKTEIEYDLCFHEMHDDGAEFITLPLDRDVVFYGISYGDTSCMVYKHKDCSYGCYYVPIVPCADKEILLNRVQNILYKLVLQLRQKNYKNMCFRVDVHKFLRDGSKYVALSLTNKHKKDKIIHDLNIKTTLVKPIANNPIESWIAVLGEYACDSQVTILNQVDISEILDFESTDITIYNINKYALISGNNGRLYEQGCFRAQLDEYCAILQLESEDSSFYACFYNEASRRSFINPKRKKHGSIYSSRVYRMSGIDEIHKNIKKMIETFRKISGFTICKTIVLYRVVKDDCFDVCISTFAVEHELSAAGATTEEIY